MDIWLVSDFWLLRIILLWTLMYKSFVSMFLFVLSVYAGMKLLGPMVIMYVAFGGTVKLFSRVVAPFVLPFIYFPYYKHFVSSALIYPLSPLFVILSSCFTSTLNSHTYIYTHTFSKREVKQHLNFSPHEAAWCNRKLPHEELYNLSFNPSFVLVSCLNWGQAQVLRSSQLPYVKWKALHWTL